MMFRLSQVALLFLSSALTTCGTSDDINRFDLRFYDSSISRYSDPEAIDTAKIVYGKWVDEIFEKINEDQEYPMNALTIGRYIYVDNSFFSLPVCRQAAVLAHESVHVLQFSDMGIWNFAVDYIADYISARKVDKKNHYSAYLSIKQEQKAQAKQEEVLEECEAL